MRTLPYVIHKKDSSALLEAIFRRGTLPVRSHRTIEEFSSYWFKNVAHHVRASSLINYRRRFIHIIAKLGKVDLADLTRAQVAQFAVDLLQRGYARGTVFGIVSSLREMYFDAMEYGEAFYNPACTAPVKFGQVVSCF